MKKVLDQLNKKQDSEMVDRLFFELSKVDSWDYRLTDGVGTLVHKKEHLLIRVQEISGGTVRGLFDLKDTDISFLNVMFLCNGNIDLRFPLSPEGNKLYCECIEEIRLKWIIRNEEDIFNMLKGFDLPKGEKK